MSETLKKLNHIASQPALSYPNQIQFIESHNGEYIISKKRNMQIGYPVINHILNTIQIAVPTDDLLWSEDNSQKNLNIDESHMVSILAISQIMMKAFIHAPDILFDLSETLFKDPKTEKRQDLISSIQLLMKRYPISLKTLFQRVMSVNIRVNLYGENFMEFYQRTVYLERENIRTYAENAVGRDKDLTMKMLDFLEDGWNTPKIMPLVNGQVDPNRQADLTTICVASACSAPNGIFSLLESGCPIPNEGCHNLH